MTEIIKILIQILFILFIISFPITLLGTNNKSKYVKNGGGQNGEKIKDHVGERMD